jgi:two-component sensor histidine kinase
MALPSSAIRLSRIVCIMTGTIAVVVGLVVLIGWWADVTVLRSIWPGFATMKPNTASLFLLTGLSLWMASSHVARFSRSRLIGLVTSATVTAVALLTLSQYVLSVDFGIDQLLFRIEPTESSPHPGRMAIATATVFALVGFGLLLHHAGVVGTLLHIPAVLALLISMLCCLSFIYNPESLRTVGPFSSVAIHTAVTMLVVSIGLVAAPPTGIVSLLCSDRLGGVIARRILPVAILIPAVTGWLRLAGQQAGWYSFEFGLALFALSNITLFTALVLWSSFRVDKTEAQRQAIADTLRELNAELETRVVERTAALTASHDLLQKSLREKEVLLKEIHHRVKNNLQIVSTLLELQSKQTRDTAALAMFKESRGRVKSMALIHERLYRSSDLARVDFAEYVRQLAADLSRTCRVTHEEVRLELDVVIEPLPIDIAIPCGLLLNELISNCFKHAFRATRSGHLRVSLHGGGGGPNVLTVADNGVGIPDGFDFRKTESFGMQLVVTLVEQLGGEIELSTASGTCFTVRFPIAKTMSPGTRL